MRLTLVMVFCAMLAACASAGAPIRMYEGTARPDSEVATLLPPTIKDGSLVLYVDRVKTSNCTWNCSFHGPVQVLPGQHRIHTDWYLLKGAAPDAVGVIPDDASEATDVSRTLKEDAYAFTFDSKLEAGKQYVMRFAVGRKAGGQSRPYAWWQETSTN